MRFYNITIIYVNINFMNINSFVCGHLMILPGGGGLMPGGGGRAMFMTAGDVLGSRLK